MSSPAYLLVTHGSRNQKSQASTQIFLQTLKPHLPNAQLFHAQLEGADQPLHQQILHLTQQSRNQGTDRLHILPLFLIPGVHIMEDLPQEVALAQESLSITDPIFKLSTLAYLGQQLQNHPHLFLTQPSHQRLLLTHGSKRPESLKLIETLAQTLHSTPAYWSIEPSLSSHLQTLTQQGHQQIQILFHFLFPGTITDKLHDIIQAHRQQNPNQTITTTEPLASLPSFQTLIAQILETSSHAEPRI